MIAAVTPTIRSKMIQFASSITKDPGAAETLVNDVVVKAAELMDPAAVPENKIVSYLMTMLRNAAFSWFRHDRVVRTHLHFCRDVTAESTIASAISREAVDYFRKLVGGLPKAFQRVILLKVLENLSYRQISKRMRIPIGTVMSRMHRARHGLLKFVEYLKAE